MAAAGRVGVDFSGVGFIIITMDKEKNDKPQKPQPENKAEGVKPKEKEIGGRNGPDPTRYGDWEKGGKCVDF